MAPRCQAQGFTNLHNFTYGNDGAAPYGGLVLSGATLYGTASTAGSENAGFFAGGGEVFKVGADGSGFTPLHGFTTPFFNTNTDGASPKGTLLLGGGTLYGTTSSGSTNGSGVVFSVSTNGSSFANVYTFTATSGSAETNIDGANPMAGLILSNGIFYGTAVNGGKFGNGTVFSMNTNGGNFSTLHHFTGGDDGAAPEGELLLSGKMLYGTASAGGSAGWGTVFAVSTNGNSLATLYNFTNGDDGSAPVSGLTLLGATLYGTASSGGIGGNGGTVFCVNTNGSNFRVLHEFSGSADGRDGFAPAAGLLLANNVLYGTTSAGGAAGNGTVFAISADGSSYQTVYSFSALDDNYDNSDGAMPMAGLVQGGNFIYGTASSGGNPGNGSGGEGTVFGLLAPPLLAVAMSGPDLTLTWPATYTGFSLQTSTNLAASNWGAVAATPTVSNGLESVTVTNSGVFRFYRLKD